MKRKSLYVFATLLLLGAGLFVGLRKTPPLQNKVVAFFPLKERPGALAQTAEWYETRQRAGSLIRQVRENERDHKSALALVALYIRESRASGYHGYYEEAALHYVNRVLAQEPANFEALLLKALLELAQHRFSEGLLTASKAQKINPYNALVYGLMVDGYVEMGNYKAAVECSDKMVSLRPDIRSYSRIAYLREIHGDYRGAIEAMKMAVEAGLPGDESTAWTRVQLARLYEHTGDTGSARMQFDIALDERPGYPYAWAGIARLAMAKGDYPTAVGWCRKAAESSGDGVIKDQLAELYILSGEKDKARAIIWERKEDLTAQAEKTGGQQNNQAHADGELMELYMLEGDYKKALCHAKAEWERRPENIDVNDWMAWVYYKLGAPEKAAEHMSKIFVTNSKNPTLLCHAGLIYAQVGERDKARKFLREALKNNPVLDPGLKAACKDRLQALLSRPG